jgi:hypothetical protein
MDSRVKLKHLDILLSEKIDYAVLMKDILCYQNTWFRKVRNFVTKFKEVYILVEEIKKFHHDSAELNELSDIIKPAKVDHICYLAMLELQALMNSESELSMGDYIAIVISIVCYEDNYSQKYKSDSKEFLELKEKVLERPLEDMIAIYNWILEDVTKSSLEWEKRFFRVQLIDPDSKAGGEDDLSQFNVISTLTTICSEFNLPIDQAWYVSYDLVQMNSYRHAYTSKVQDNIRIIKEAKIKANQQK